MLCCCHGSTLLAGCLGSGAVRWLLTTAPRSSCTCRTSAAAGLDGVANNSPSPCLVVQKREEENACLCQEPGCAIWVASKCQKSWCMPAVCLLALGLRAEVREITGGDCSMARQVGCGWWTLAARQKHEDMVRCPTGDCSQLASALISVSLYQPAKLRVQSCLAAAEENSTSWTAYKGHRTPGWDMQVRAVRRNIICLFNSRFICSLCRYWWRIVPVQKLSRREKGNNTIWLSSFGIWTT